MKLVTNMEKVLQPFPSLPPITVLAINEYFDKGDTPPTIYTACKLSVSLSNGMSGVYGDLVFPTVRGDIVVFNPTEVHFGRVTVPGMHRFLDLYIPHAFFENLGPCGAALTALFYGEPDKHQQFIVPDEERAAILGLAEQIESLAASTDESDEIKSFGLVLELLCLVATLAEKQEGNPAEWYPRITRKAVQYMDEHYGESLSLRVLAEYVGCSVTYLTKTFRTSTGKTIFGYLIERRLSEACRMLANGDGVAEIAFACGFTDSSHFIKTFKKYFGTTPAKYRADHKQ